MKYGERKGDWIQTYTGRQFWPLDPRPEEIFIEDIAHALAMQCRFGGHCRWHYSVAQHSVYVSHQVPRARALEALLHDAAEAYLVDVPRPIKRHLYDYKVIEQRLQAAIGERFNIEAWRFDTGVVQAADMTVGQAEKEQIMAPPPAPWRETIGAAPIKVRRWWIWYAKWRFLRRFEELIAQRAAFENHFWEEAA